MAGRRRTKLGILTKNKVRITALVGVLIVAASATVWYAWYMGYLAPFTVRIGYLTADIHHLALFVAQEKGWFQGAEMRFQFIESANGPIEMMRIGAGEIDIGYLGVVPATLFKINFGVNVTIVAAANKEGSALVVSSAINSTSNLNGTRIATPGENTVQRYLLSLIERNYGINTVHLPMSPPSTMESALQSGAISGFIGWEPFPAKSITDGVGKILLTSHDIWPDHPCCVLVISGSFLETRPDIVQMIVNNHVSATNFILQNSDESVTIGAKYTGQVNTVIQDALTRTIFDYHPDKEGMRTIIEHLINVGWIPPDKVPSNITTFLNSFVNTEYIGA